MKYFLLFYEIEPDGYVEKRAPHRPKHLELIEAAHARGEVVLAGAYGEPPSGAVLLFRAESADTARAFAEADPYVKNGLIKSWSVQPWHVVVGEGSSR